jgi:hypothetical protein
MGQIYIAWDITKPTMAKVGKTTLEAEARISQTENPDYELFKSYPIYDVMLDHAEVTIHIAISRVYERKIHRSSGRPSEWFQCTPEQASIIVGEQIIMLLNAFIAKLSKCKLKEERLERGRLSQIEAEQHQVDENYRLAKIEDERLQAIENDKLAKVEVERLQVAEKNRLAKVEAERMERARANSLIKKKRRAEKMHKATS